MQQNLIKIPVIAQLDDKLWEGSSRDVSPRVVLQFQPLDVTFFTSDVGTLCGMSKKFVSSCLHCFSVFTFSVALANLFAAGKPNQRNTLPRLFLPHGFAPLYLPVYCRLLSMHSPLHLVLCLYLPSISCHKCFFHFCVSG